MSLELSMVYYHILFNENASNLCTIFLPCGKYCYKRLPMGVANSPDNFQHKMNDWFHILEFIRAFIDDILILTKGDWTDHVQKLELTLNKLKEKWLTYNIGRSFFGQTEMEYLGFWVTRDVVKLININMEVITNMKLPTSQK